MASSGDCIKYSNFSNTAYTGKCYVDIDSQGNTQNDKCYCYISAPSWYAKEQVDKNWGTWGRSWGVTACYYTGSEWKQAWSWSDSAGQFDSGSWSKYFYHNHSSSSTSGDVPSAILWELAYRIPELYRKRLWVYAGGIGCMGEQKYKTLCTTNPTLVYSSGNLSDSSIYYAGRNNQDRSGAIKKFKWSDNTGTLIYATNETKLVWGKNC